MYSAKSGLPTPATLLEGETNDWYWQRQDLEKLSKPVPTCSEAEQFALMLDELNHVN